MEFRIDDSKIRKIKSLLRKEKMPLFILWIIEKIALISGIIISVGYTIFSYSSNKYYDHNGYLTTRYNIVIRESIFVLACCLFVWGVLRFTLTMVQNYAVIRVSNEVVKIDRNILYYCFEPRDISGFNNLINIIAIDLNTLSCISLNEKNRKLTIGGKMLGVKVDMINELKITSEKMCEKKVQLFDYFSPSLYDMLVRYEEITQKARSI